MWQVVWAHPKFGSILASCSYDRQVIIWKELTRNHWVQIYQHRGHDGSGDGRQNPLHCMAEAHLLANGQSERAGAGTPGIAARPAPRNLRRLTQLAPLTVNAVAWSPQEHGLCLACGSSDETISVLTSRGDLAAAHRHHRLTRFI